MKQAIIIQALFVCMQATIYATQVSTSLNEGYLEPQHATSPSQEAFEALNQGDIYFYGLFDVEKNHEKAQAWYEKAASPQASSDVRKVAKQRLQDLAHEKKLIQK